MKLKQKPRKDLERISRAVNKIINAGQCGLDLGVHPTSRRPRVSHTHVSNFSASAALRVTGDTAHIHAATRSGQK
jgi:hypothetical protein